VVLAAVPRQGAGEGEVPGLLTRILRGNALRRTRFHDEKGNPVPLVALLYLPTTVATWLVRVVLGRRPHRPTLSFRACAHLATRLRPDWNAVEFGSGMSTAWLGARVGSLLSIEDNAEWAGRVREILAARGLANVRHELRPGETYAVLDDIPSGHFDFALIDGSDRAGCVGAVLPKMRRGGLIYLDNSDKDMTRPEGDTRRAEALLLEAAAANDWRVRYFTDFSPTNLFAEQGMLVELP
jgi:hypothetical protein